MTFFAPDEKDKQINALVEQLAAVAKRGKAGAFTYSPSKWWIEFSSLVKAHGLETVQKVLKWHISHYGEELVPVARSASAFRTKWDAIRKAMISSDETVESVEPDIMDMSDKLLANYKYPVEIARLLPIILQRTKDNWGKFLTRLRQVEAPGQREGNFILMVCNSYGHNFPEEWGHLIGEQFGNMEHYRGAPLRLVFTSESEIFRNSFWSKWESGWTGKIGTFSELLKKVSKK